VTKAAAELEALFQGSQREQEAREEADRTA